MNLENNSKETVSDYFEKNPNIRYTPQEVMIIQSMEKAKEEDASKGHIERFRKKLVEYSTLKKRTQKDS